MDIEKVIIQNNLIPSDGKIGVAVSGGRDSMAMLHFLMQNKDTFKISKIVCVNVEHGIRGDSSKRDSQVVEDFCKKHNVECLKFSVDIPALANQRRKGIEQVARDERYRIFGELYNSGVIDRIAVAHHLQDQAETVLMHLFRGAGVNGVLGMDFVRDGYIIRPMLLTDRIEIDGYIKANNIPFIDDESNSDNKYTRNYLRNDIVPKIEKAFPNFQQNIVRFLKLIKNDEEYLERQAEKYIKSKTDNSVAIDIKSDFFDVILSRAVLIALRHLNASVDIQKTHIDNVIELAKNSENGSCINLPNGIDVYKDYGVLSLQRRKKIQSSDSVVAFALGKVTLCHYEITIERTDFDKTGEGLFLALNKIPEDAVFRFRQKGDIFKKYNGGSKKLKDYFIDKKINARNRDSIPLLCSGKVVLAVLNIQIGDAVKICDGDDVINIKYKKLTKDKI